MTGLRVSELAARAGVRASTVRFYERAGLLSPARRAANGYRVFGDSALDDLVLIGRAKRIGMNLDEISSLVAAWHGSSEADCQVAHALLREHLIAQTGRLNDEMAGLAEFRQRGQAAFGRLTARQPERGGCHGHCACTGALAPAPESQPAPAPAPAPDDATPRPAGCTLGNDELACRVGEWRALAEAALSAERDGGFLRLTLEPAMIPTASTLILAETVCCPDARFTLAVAGGQAFLTAEFPR